MINNSKEEHGAKKLNPEGSTVHEVICTSALPMHIEALLCGIFYGET